MSSDGTTDLGDLSAALRSDPAAVAPAEIYRALREATRHGAEGLHESAASLAADLQGQLPVDQRDAKLGHFARTALRLLQLGEVEPALATVAQDLSGEPVNTTVDGDRAYVWLPGFRDPRAAAPDTLYDITDSAVLRVGVDHLEAVDGSVVVGGWAYLAHLRAERDDVVTLLLRDSEQGVARRVTAERLRRPDHVRASGTDLTRLVWSGFRATLPISSLTERSATWTVEVEVAKDALARVGGVPHRPDSFPDRDLPFLLFRSPTSTLQVRRDGRRRLVLRSGGKDEWPGGDADSGPQARTRRAGSLRRRVSRRAVRQYVGALRAGDGRPGILRVMSPTTTWRRRLLAVGERLGLHVTNVRPGAVVVSRSAGYRARPLLEDDETFLVTRRSDAPVAVADLDGAARLVARKPAPAVERTGKGVWLVAPSSSSEAEALTQETETLKHLGQRHVAWLLQHHRVDCVLDVGANKGQYGRALRDAGYTGHIVSFEPVPDFFEELRAVAARDSRWSVHQMALGSEDSTVPIHVQRTFSSLLNASAYGKQRFSTLREAAANDRVVDVPLRRLDGLLDSILEGVRPSGGGVPRLYLKMDTQGYDVEAFRGLGDRVADFVGMQSEVALLTIYDGMPRMSDALPIYEAAGFEISGLYPVTREKDGRVIEYDCVMVRNEQPST